MPENQTVPYRLVAQVALWVLALFITGASGLILTTLNDHADRLNTNEKWMQQLQDSQNLYAYRIEQNEAAVRDLKAQQILIQHQSDLDQEALHDLADAFQREFPLKHR